MPAGPGCLRRLGQGLTDDGHACATYAPQPVRRGWGMPAEFGCLRRLDAEIFVFWLTLPGGIGIPRVCMEYECYSISGIITP